MLHFLVWAILAALRPKAPLVAENLCLRQQFLVLHRNHPQALWGANRRLWALSVDNCEHRSLSYAWD